MPAAIPGDPLSSFASGFGASLGGQIGGQLMGGSEPTTKVTSNQADQRSFFDGSGWTVSTGSSKASGATISRTGDPWGQSSIAGMKSPVTNSPSVAMQTGGASFAFDPLTLGAGLLLVLLVLKRKGA